MADNLWQDYDKIRLSMFCLFSRWWWSNIIGKKSNFIFKCFDFIGMFGSLKETFYKMFSLIFTIYVKTTKFIFKFVYFSGCCIIYGHILNKLPQRQNWLQKCQNLVSICFTFESSRYRLWLNLFSHHLTLL